MLRIAKEQPASSPALALRTSLAAGGFLHTDGVQADTTGAGAWWFAQAVHQGDRMLRTARTLLKAHAHARGDHCSLWVVDGKEVVAILCEQPEGRQPGADGPFGPGCRWAVGADAISLVQHSTTHAGIRGEDSIGHRIWTAKLRRALLCGRADADFNRSTLLASRVPWQHWPMVLATIDRSTCGPGTAYADASPEHQQRHLSLSLSVAWSLDAVVL